MNVAIIGAGNIGGTLATALARAGHEVTVGVRDPAGRSVDGCAVTDLAGALDGAEAVVLAQPGPAVEPYLAEHGSALEGVVVIDAANSVGGGGTTHHAAAFAEHAPGALMVRAFNTLGWENFGDPVFGDEVADLFWCGPDGRASDVAERLIRDVGLRPVRVGGPEAVDVVDALLPVWFTLSRAYGTRRLAFRTLGLD